MVFVKKKKSKIFAIFFMPKWKKERDMMGYLDCWCYYNNEKKNDLSDKDESQTLDIEIP